MAVASSFSPPPALSSPCPPLTVQNETSYHSVSYAESILLHLDGTRVTEKVIGQGSTGIVIEREGYAFKLPHISRHTKVDGVAVEVRPLTPEQGDYDERPHLIQAIELEKAIYKRLGCHRGIVRCHNLESTHVSIQMDLMSLDLRHYLAYNKPERKTLLSWFTTIAQTMAYVHEHRIIIADVRLDNILVDDMLAVKICDFGGSTLMPLDWDLDGTDDDGFSVLTDIGEFGKAMYEAITGLRCKFDMAQDCKEPGDPYTFPRRDSLPSTKNIWLGHIIEKCWTQVFKSAKELAAQLGQERVPSATE